MRVYLAGPVQNAHSQDWREDIKRDHGDRFEFIDPMNWSDYVGVPTDKRGHPKSHVELKPREIRWKCEGEMELADGLFAFKPADMVTDGTAMEIRMAAAEYGIPVVAWTSVDDQLGDFTEAHVDYTGPTFEDCLRELEHLITHNS